MDDLNDEILALMGNAPSSKSNNKKQVSSSDSSSDSEDDKYNNKRDNSEPQKKSRRSIGRYTRSRRSDLSSTEDESEPENDNRRKEPLTNMENEAQLYDLEEKQLKDRESDFIQQRLAQVRNNANSTMANLQQSDRRSNRRDTTKSQNLDELKRRRIQKSQGNNYSERYDYDDNYSSVSHVLQPTDLLTVDQARSILLTRELICDYSNRPDFKEKVIDALVRVNVTPGDYSSDQNGYCLGKIAEITIGESTGNESHTHGGRRKYNVVLEFMPSGTMTIPIETVSNSKCSAREVELYAQALINQGTTSLDISYILDNLQDLENSDPMDENDLKADSDLLTASDEASQFAKFCRDPKIYTQVVAGTYKFPNLTTEIEYCYNQTLSLRFRVQSVTNSITDNQKRNAMLKAFKIKTTFWTKKHDDAKIKLQRQLKGDEVEYKIINPPVFTNEELNTKLYNSTHDKKVFDYNSRFPPSKHDGNKKSSLAFLDDFCDNNQGILSNKLNSTNFTYHPSDFQLAILKTKDDYMKSTFSKI